MSTPATTSRTTGAARTAAATGRHTLARTVALRTLGAVELACVAALAPGCLVLPFAVPPTSLSAAAGAAIGKVRPVEEGGSGETTAQPVVIGRAGLAPLGLTPDLADRRFDFQLGYVIEAVPKEFDAARYLKHGAYGAFTFYPWVGEGNWRGRVGLSPIAEVLVEPARDLVGGGGGVRAELDIVAHGEGSYAGIDDKGLGVIGGAYGEYGIGLNSSVLVRGVGSERYWVVTGGLTFRLPAIAGVLLVPLWALD